MITQLVVRKTMLSPLPTTNTFVSHYTAQWPYEIGAFVSCVVYRLCGKGIKAFQYTYDAPLVSNASIIPVLFRSFIPDRYIYQSSRHGARICYKHGEYHTV